MSNMFSLFKNHKRTFTGFKLFTIQSAAVNCSFSDNLTPLGVFFIFLAKVPQTNAMFCKCFRVASNFLCWNAVWNSLHIPCWELAELSANANNLTIFRCMQRKNFATNKEIFTTFTISEEYRKVGRVQWEFLGGFSGNSSNPEKISWFVNSVFIIHHINLESFDCCSIIMGHSYNTCSRTHTFLWDKTLTHTFLFFSYSSSVPPWPITHTFNMFIQ